VHEQSQYSSNINNSASVDAKNDREQAPGDTIITKPSDNTVGQNDGNKTCGRLGCDHSKCTTSVGGQHELK
ncbi:unnamed protein product, partial [Didymodactylos carnosus]